MHEDYQFSVKSSDGLKQYFVVFQLAGETVKVKCNCKAGSLGRMCRHKKELIAGNADLLIDLSDTQMLFEVKERIEKSELAPLLVAIHDAENDVGKAQIKLKQLQKQLTKTIGS